MQSCWDLSFHNHHGFGLTSQFGLIGCALLLYTQPTYEHMNPRLVYVPLEPDHRLAYIHIAEKYLVSHGNRQYECMLEYFSVRVTPTWLVCCTTHFSVLTLPNLNSLSIRLGTHTANCQEKFVVQHEKYTHLA